MFTADDLYAIDEAIASGELTVKIDGREVTYRSVSDLQKARRAIVRRLKRQQGGRNNPLAGIQTHVNRGLS